MTVARGFDLAPGGAEGNAPETLALIRGFPPISPSHPASDAHLGVHRPAANPGRGTREARRGQPLITLVDRLRAPR